MRIDHNSFGSLIYWLVALAIAALCLVSANSCVGTFSTIVNRDSRNTNSSIHGTTSQDSASFTPSLHLSTK